MINYVFHEYVQTVNIIYGCITCFPAINFRVRSEAIIAEIMKDYIQCLQSRFHPIYIYMYNSEVHRSPDIDNGNVPV